MDDGVDSLHQKFGQRDQNARKGTGIRNEQKGEAETGYGGRERRATAAAEKNSGDEIRRPRGVSGWASRGEMERRVGAIRGGLGGIESWI